jgi:hypothetical protein
MLVAVPALGGGGGMRMAIMMATAEVRPSASFAFVAAMPDFTIGEADIKRGYVEMPAASLLKMSLPGGNPEVVFEFSADETPFKSVEVLADEIAEPGFTDPSDAKAVYLHSAQLRYRFNFRDTWPPARQAVPVVMTINL